MGSSQDDWQEMENNERLGLKPAWEANFEVEGDQLKMIERDNTLKRVATSIIDLKEQRIRTFLLKRGWISPQERCLWEFDVSSVVYSAQCGATCGGPRDHYDACPNCHRPIEEKVVWS